jgi:hypothetical protein
MYRSPPDHQFSTNDYRKLSANSEDITPINGILWLGRENEARVVYRRGKKINSGIYFIIYTNNRKIHDVLKI